MTVKILIGPGVNGLALSPSIVASLFELDRSLFNEPIPREMLVGGLPVQTDAELEAMFVHSHVVGTDVYFLNEGAELRTNAWLIDKFTIEGAAALAAEPRAKIKIVEIPDGVDWYVYKDDCGSESIHETHRVWN